MIYIVGVTHDVQCLKNENSEEAKEFYNNMMELCNDNGITVIIEEFSESAKSKNQCDYATMEKLANDIGIEHEFCDPTCEERNELGISDTIAIQLNAFFDDNFNQDAEKEKQFEIRENYWLDIIKDYYFDDDQEYEILVSAHRV
jgi:hypothetical protein